MKKAKFKNESKVFAFGNSDVWYYPLNIPAPKLDTVREVKIVSSFWVNRKCDSDEPVLDDYVGFAYEIMVYKNELLDTTRLMIYEDCLSKRGVK